MLLRERKPQPLHEADHVRPGDEPNVGQPVIRSRETEARHEHPAIVLLRRQRSGIHIEYPDQRSDVVVVHLVTKRISITHVVLLVIEASLQISTPQPALNCYQPNTESVRALR